MIAIRVQAFPFAIAMALVTWIGASAAPPVGQPIDPEMHKWYESLRQPGTGAGCCSIADCRPYDSRVADDHYEILDHTRWLPIPNNVVLHRENKAGTAIACTRTQWNYGFGPPPASRPTSCASFPDQRPSSFHQQGAVQRSAPNTQSTGRAALFAIADALHEEYAATVESGCWCELMTPSSPAHTMSRYL
jgi:hypothetical protein